MLHMGHHHHQGSIKLQVESKAGLIMLWHQHSQRRLISSYSGQLKSNLITVQLILIIRPYSYIVHSNSPFSASQNSYFCEFVDYICPFYIPPTCYVLSHSILESEVARVHLGDLEQLENSRNQTLLYDGWEDGLGRSIYGAVSASDGEYPIILGLDNMTGQWGTAEGYLESTKGAMQKGGIAKGKQVLALTTDNPSVIKSFWRLFQAESPWVLVWEISCRNWLSFVTDMYFIDSCILPSWFKHNYWDYPAMKLIITTSACIVSFFNGSHYWGGQLEILAKTQGISHGLKTNTESWWYAMIL